MQTLTRESFERDAYERIYKKLTDSGVDHNAAKEEARTRAAGITSWEFDLTEVLWSE